MVNGIGFEKIRIISISKGKKTHEEQMA